MNRIVANDLEARANNQYSINDFHSQGTVIGKGINSILESKGLKYDEGYQINAIGPAVEKESQYKSINNLNGDTDKNIRNGVWDSDPDDQVKYFANPLMHPIDFLKGVYITGKVISGKQENKHSTDNKRYHKYLEKDKNHDYSNRPYQISFIWSIFCGVS